MTMIAVTGASGYLGGEIVRLLKESGRKVIAVGRTSGDFLCNLDDEQEVAVMVNTLRPDSIIHCAAVVPSNHDAYSDNVAAEYSLKLIQNLVAASPKHIVFTSSMTVYRADQTMPVSEDDALEPEAGYGGGKRRAEVLLAKSSGNTTVLRFPGLFGGVRKDGLLYNIAQAFSRGQVPRLPEKPPLWGALHVNDAARICIAASEKRNNGRSLILNAGYPNVQATHLAVEALAKRFGCSVPGMSIGPLFQMNVERVKKVLGRDFGDWNRRLDELVDAVLNEEKQHDQ